MRKEFGLTFFESPPGKPGGPSGQTEEGEYPKAHPAARNVVAEIERDAEEMAGVLSGQATEEGDQPTTATFGADPHDLGGAMPS